MHYKGIGPENVVPPLLHILKAEDYSTRLAEQRAHNFGKK
jgi:hypothetical protein